MHPSNTKARGIALVAVTAGVIASQPLLGQDTAGRRETRADQRIQRQLEHEFAGDVERSGSERARVAGRFTREVMVDELGSPASPVRRLFTMEGPAARAAIGSIARAHLRGVDDDELVITVLDDGVRVVNRDGKVLVDLDEEDVRILGRWEITPVAHEVGRDAPAFCHSGVGHPTFGRHWCVDKRLGLGARDDFHWGRTDRITDLELRPPGTTAKLSRDALLSLLGPIAFDRLALHAITLGLIDPLTGRWLVAQEPGAPRVLRVSSGSRDVAEIVDIDQDNRVDMIVVALRAW